MRRAVWPAAGIPAAPGTNSAAQSNKTMLSQWRVECDCAMCEDERGVSAAVLGKLRRLVEGFNGVLVSLDIHRGMRAR